MFLFFTGVVLIVVNQLIVSNTVRTKYVYLPRDLDTYLRELPFATVVFGSMFNGSDNIGPNNETGATDGITGPSNGGVTGPSNGVTAAPSAT